MLPLIFKVSVIYEIKKLCRVCAVHAHSQRCRFFGIELLKIYLINSNVSNLKIRKKFYIYHSAPPYTPVCFHNQQQIFYHMKIWGQGTSRKKIPFLQCRLTKRTRELRILRQNIVDKTIRLIISGTVEFLSVSMAKILVNLFYKQLWTYWSRSCSCKALG